MENQENIKGLLSKYLNGKYTPEEYKTLLRYFDLEDNESRAKQLLYNAISSSELYQEIESERLNRVTDAAFDRLQKRINRKSRIISIYTSIKIAATALLFAAIGLYIYFYQLDNDSGDSINNTVEKIIPPGGNRATITMANGEQLTLSDQADGLISSAEGLSYADGSSIKTIEHVQTVVLQTPRAGQYSVRLSDGTKVWLNATSSLSYPTEFTSTERRVVLKGEAYFEVAKNRQKPFIVEAYDQIIRVTGTQFNVQAYENESVHQTTLVEGSVVLRKANVQKDVVLKPGQQALTSDQQTLTIKSVNTEEYTSWKDGIIMLNSNELPDILRQLERWYDVTFEHVPAHLKTEKVFGMIDRAVPLNDVIKTLEANYNVKFKINGRRIIMSVP